MKALVAIKRVVDYNVRVRVKSDHSDVDISNAKMSINPFCEIAVEEAVRLKEQGIVSEIVVVSIGEAEVQEQIRAALAMGADRGILIETSENLTSLSVAKLLTKVVSNEEPEIIILGKQAIDSDNNQTCQMLAALCDYPQATFASKVTVNGNSSVVVEREVDGGLQTLSMTLPAIISTDLRLNTPRFVKLPDVMKAKKKPITKTTPEEMGINIDSNITLLGVEPPSERSPGILVGSVDELLECLRTQSVL